MSIKMSPAKLFFFCLLQATVLVSAAQQGSFGIVTCKIPDGYETVKKIDVLTYYKQDKGTGAYCLFFIYDLVSGKGSVKNDFDFAWANIVQKNISANAVPVMQPQADLKGWEFLSGNAVITEKGASNMATLITFSGENKTQSVYILCNAAQYKKDIEDFIASIDVVRTVSQQPAGNKTGETKTANDNTPSLKNTATVLEGKNCYSITVPPTWKLNTGGGSLLLEKSTAMGNRVIEFMNPIKSSGDLEKDMAHIFFEVFDGWELRIPNITLFTEAEQQKGLTCQGLNYYMLSGSIKKKGSYDVIKATVLLIQAGGQVAIINSTDNILGSEVEMALHFLLFNLKLKGVAEKNVNYKEQLIGTWASGSGTYGNSLNTVSSFTAGGKCYALTQSSYTVGYDYYNDLIRKKQFKTEGSFNLDGNVLERKVGSGTVSKYFIRFYSRRYGDRSWEDLMSLYECDFDKEKINSVLHFHKI